MHKTDLLAMGTWVGIAFVLWVVAWVVAMAIPVFNELLSLIVFIPSFFPEHRWQRTMLTPLKASLFASWFTCMSLSSPFSLLSP